MTHNLGMAQYRLPGPGICPPDFKSPSETQTTAPSNPKKRRKTSNSTNVTINSQPPPSPQDLLPPPLTGYGDTIVASNPFDDTPPNLPMHSSPGIAHMGMHPVMNHMHHQHHMAGPPMRGLNAMAINNMSPISGMSPMGPGPGMGPMGPHIGQRGNMSPMGGMHGHQAQLGGLSPMGNMGPTMTSMGPMGGMSPMGGPNSHMSIVSNNSRSMGSPMSGGPIGSPMNTLSMGGSPMGSAMGSPMSSQGGGHINNGQMGPPIHSPLGNGPGPHLQQGPPRMNVPNGAMTSSLGNLSHQMGPLANHPQNNSMSNVNMNLPGSNQQGGPNLSNMGQCNSSIGTIGGAGNGPGSGHNSGNSGPISHQNVPMSQSVQMPPSQNNTMNSQNLHSINMSGISSSGHHTMSSGPPQNHSNHQLGQMSSLPPPNLGNSNLIGPPGGVGMFGKPMPVGAGKIYPPNQPMVFNPQNPNAPPIYPCGVCHKEVHDNDQAMLCESGCNFWFHRSCSGLTEAAFQLIHAEVYAEWVCDKCLSSKNIPLVKFKP